MITQTMNEIVNKVGIFNYSFICGFIGVIYSILFDILFDYLDFRKEKRNVKK